MTPRRVILALLLLLPAVGALAGTLGIGAITADDAHYTVPIVLSGDGGEVAALDFRLRYDPAVFEPLAAVAGPAAVQANKVVAANMPAPGEFIVVMMGLNQTTVNSGEVARLELRRIGTPASGSSELEVADPTLATWEGVELPVQGASATVGFGTSDSEGEREDTDSDANGEEERLAEEERSSDSRTDPERSQSSLDAARTRVVAAVPAAVVLPGGQSMATSASVEDAGPAPLKKPLANVGEDALAFQQGTPPARTPEEIGGAEEEGVRNRTETRLETTETTEQPAKVPGVVGAAIVESESGKDSRTAVQTGASEGTGNAPRRIRSKAGIAMGVIVVITIGLAGLFPLRRRLFR